MHPHVLVGLLVAVGLLAANAFFVASEFAIVKCRPVWLEALARKGNLSARTALAITRNLDAYLSANQIGITVASLALGWIGEAAFAEVFRRLLAPLGWLTGLATHGLASVLALALLTFLHTAIGEQAPKLFAIRRSEAVTLWTATPLRVFYVLAWPFIRAVDLAARTTLRLLGLQRDVEAERGSAPEELRLLLARAAIDPGARALIDRVFDYTRRVARHVMTARPEVVVLDVTRSFADNVIVARASQYTRFPLVDPEHDRVLGFVHMKDIFAAMADWRWDTSTRALAREPLFIAEDMPLEQLRRQFQRRRVHFAVVLDPTGAFTGIVTLEDLLEELVGEIRDEQDTDEVPPFVRHPDGTIEADGRLMLDVTSRELGLSLSEAETQGIETLGGYITARLGYLPERGTVVDLGGLLAEVIDMQHRCVHRVRIRPAPERTAAAPAERADPR